MYAIAGRWWTPRRLTQPGQRRSFYLWDGLGYSMFKLSMESDQFTLQEANALVPWLEETFQRLELVRKEYLSVQERLSDLAKNPVSDDETARVTASMESVARQIEEGVEEILDRGIIVRDVATGLVDFPSQREDREVYLCWIGGEEQIDFWHETNRGFSHRERL